MLNKSALIKLAVAAVLALPAVPAMAKTTHHKLHSRTHKHHVMTSLSHKTHRYHHRTTRHTTLSARTSLRHKSGTYTAGTVHVTKTPPTIDNMPA